MATKSFNHPFVDKVQQRGLLVGAAGLVLLFIGAFADSQQFFQSYLVGYIYWLVISLGCLGVLMLHHLVSGRWGFVIRRLLESGARHTVAHGCFVSSHYASGDARFVRMDPYRCCSQRSNFDL